MASPERFGARLVAIRPLADDVKLFTFERLDGLAMPPSTPGGHATFTLRPGLERQYSLVETGENLPALTIAVRRDPNGRGGSRHMHDELVPGAELTVGCVRNNFPLAEAAPRSVLIAGGIGITPILPMIARLQVLGRPFELHYSNRARSSAAFLAPLHALPQAQFNFDDESGRPLDLARIVAAAPADAHLYCCGPTPMLDAFVALTAKRNPQTVHWERFAAVAAIGPMDGFEVELVRSQKIIQVDPDDTILSALQRARIIAPSSCGEGICGTCETAVLGGIPDHRDQVLTDSERAAGDRMMICCSRSLSPRLLLDL